MNKRLVHAAGLSVALVALAACGGGGDDPAPVTGSDPAATPVPGQSPAPGGTTGGGAAPAPAPGGGLTPAPAPISAPSPATPPTTGAIPAVASLPAGQPTGGTAAKSPSGYSDQLLAGRWAFLTGAEPGNAADSCIDLPAFACGGTQLSFAGAVGYLASGNTATEILEFSFHRGMGCEAPGRVALGRIAADIAFDAADTSIDDRTLASGTGQIAVRRGVYGALRVDFTEGDATALAALFAACPAMNPVPESGESPTPEPEACTASVQLRIEAGAGGPVLITDDESACQAGTVAPAARFKGDWGLTQDDGLLKLP